MVTHLPPAAVTYIGLPISSGGAHSLGRMPRRVAHERTLAFLRTCTVPVGAPDYLLRVHDVPELRPDPVLEREVERRFGGRVGLREDQVGDVLDFLDDIDPQPANRWGMVPVWFRIECQFRIIDPDTGRLLPGQDPAHFNDEVYEWHMPLGTSGLGLILNDHAAIRIELCLPDADEELLRRVVPWLQHHLPFKLSPKQWRSWTPTRSGGFKARRMTL
jgi:hypothetical protein